MADIKILIEGYAKKLDNGFLANSTCCLITSEDKKIITDPGCNREKLLNALKKENLKTSDINFVFLSHRHPDHILLAGIFEKAKHVTFDTNMMFENDLLTEFDMNMFGEDIKIIETPGHVSEHLSLLIDTPKGKVAIAGDTIWWLGGEEQIFNIKQIDQNQAIDLDMEKLIESRKKLVELSDYIIPGHGKMFKVDK